MTFNLDKCDLRETLVSTLSVLDQVVDLTLVSGTVTGLSQTISTPITSNTPRSTHCPSPKSSLELICTGQSEQSSENQSPIKSSKNNNSVNEDVPDEDTTSTTAESIVAVKPLVVLPTSSAPATPKTPENTSEPHASNILPDTTDEVITKVQKENDLNVIDEPSSSLSATSSADVCELFYGKKADEAWKKLKERFQNSENHASIPLKIQHLDVGLPDVYVTGIIDISQHKVMLDDFAEALMAMPHKRAKPLEGDILGNDWLVKRPDSVSSKDQFVRFRPTHMKENLVKGRRETHLTIV